MCLPLQGKESPTSLSLSTPRQRRVRYPDPGWEQREFLSSMRRMRDTSLGGKEKGMCVKKSACGAHCPLP